MLRWRNRVLFPDSPAQPRALGPLGESFSLLSLVGLWRKEARWAKRLVVRAVSILQPGWGDRAGVQTAPSQGNSPAGESRGQTGS